MRGPSPSPLTSFHAKTLVEGKAQIVLGVIEGEYQFELFGVQGSVSDEPDQTFGTLKVKSLLKAAGPIRNTLKEKTAA